MKILLLNGSPHAAGAGMRLAGWLLEDLAARSGSPPEVRILHLYAAGVAPCRGCAACGGPAGCRQADGAAETIAAARAADCLALASPIHFSSLSAPLIAWISRLQILWGSDHGRPPPPGAGRPAVLLASGGADYPGMFDPAVKVAAAAFRTLGRQFTGRVCVPGADWRRTDDDWRGARAEVAGLAARVAAGLRAC